MGLLTYGWADGVATIALDHGKVNLMLPVVIAEINAALDRAESDRAADAVSQSNPRGFNEIGGMRARLMTSNQIVAGVAANSSTWTQPGGADATRV
jgi:enoyl-CoA hydratase